MKLAVAKGEGAEGACVPSSVGSEYAARARGGFKGGQIELTPAAAVQVYRSVWKHSPYLVGRRQVRLARLAIWLTFLAKVAVVGGFAFGCGFLGVVAARAFGLEVGWRG